MDFSLNEDSLSVASLAGQLFGDFASDDAQAKYAASGQPWMADLHAQLGEAGLIGALVPEALGGSALGWTDAALVLEQQGRTLAPVPLWPALLASRALAEAAAPTLRDTLLPALLSGQAVAAVAFGEVEASRPSVRARLADGQLMLDGELQAVWWGAEADWVLLPAALDGQTRLVVLPRGSAGVEVTPGTFTHGGPAARLRLTGVALSADHLLGAACDGDWLLDRGSLCLGALQLGVSGAALRRTADYLTERHQFDRPLGSFQGVALRMADGFVDVEALRLQVWQLAWRLDNSLPAAGAASTAQWWACQTAHRVAHTAQHLHGGMGADVSYPIHRYFLWSRALELSLGGRSRQRQRLGHWLARDTANGVLL